MPARRARASRWSPTRSSAWPNARWSRLARSRPSSRRVQEDTARAVYLSQGLLTRMVDSVAGTSQLVGDVAQATEEQSSSARTVLGTSSQMHQIAEQLALAAREQADGAHARSCVRWSR